MDSNSRTDFSQLEWKWNQLLDYIEAGLVVPVVGRELLWAEIDGRLQYVPWYLALQLASRAEIEPPALEDPDPVATIVQRYLSSHTKGRNWPYTALSQLTKELENTTPPRALAKLAACPFALFISTTTDAYLERALNNVRYDGRRQTVVPRYGLGSRNDLSPQESGGTVVFPFLGRANPTPDYAVTAEDVLEFVHQFQATGTPRRLLDALRQSHLLMIGGGFSDWLVRFLVRLAKPGRLWSSGHSQQTLFMADRSIMSDGNLLDFLEHPLSDVEIFHVTHTDEFVDELHRRWTARHPQEETPQTWQVPPREDAAQDGGVFLSYHRSDASTARRVYEALNAAGIDVWFDERDLEGGVEFEPEIISRINRSFFFVAILSRQTLSSERSKFFRLEWRHAETRSKYAPFDSPFVLPVVIDDVSPIDERFPLFLRQVHWTKAPAGDLPSDFVRQLVTNYREAQRPGKQR